MSAPLVSATAFAPATVANVAVGFDILGFALDVTGDQATVTRIPERQVRIAAIHAPEGLSLPFDPRKNTATGGLISMIERLGLTHGFEVTIRKGIALGSGMGGSAASAVASGVAANALLDSPLPLLELMPFLLDGESLASGSRHADNLAPCLLGGLQLVRSLDPMDIISIPIPDELHCVLVHPHVEVETRGARGILRHEVPLGDFVHQSANLAAVISACHRGDYALLARALEDRIIEPQRAHLIPEFHAAKRAALAAGALGFSISGSGPSVFAWVEGEARAIQVKDALGQVYQRARVAVDLWHAPLSKPGARLLAGPTGGGR
jgi:homoserine kinase